MGRGEEDALAFGMEETRARATRAGRDAHRLAGRETGAIDLVERITGLALALVDELAAVGTEMGFAAPAAGEGELARVAVEQTFGQPGRGLVSGRSRSLAPERHEYEQGEVSGDPGSEKHDAKRATQPLKPHRTSPLCPRGCCAFAAG